VGDGDDDDDDDGDGDDDDDTVGQEQAGADKRSRLIVN